MLYALCLIGQQQLHSLKSVLRSPTAVYPSAEMHIPFCIKFYFSSKWVSYRKCCISSGQLYMTIRKKSKCKRTEKIHQIDLFTITTSPSHHRIFTMVGHFYIHELSTFIHMHLNVEHIRGDIAFSMWRAQVRSQPAAIQHENKRKTNIHFSLLKGMS